jgi:hypothetical protein
MKTTIFVAMFRVAITSSSRGGKSEEEFPMRYPYLRRDITLREMTLRHFYGLFVSVNSETAGLEFGFISSS